MRRTCLLLGVKRTLAAFRASARQYVVAANPNILAGCNKTKQVPSFKQQCGVGGISVKIGTLRAAAIGGALGCIFVWGIVGQASATVYNINEVIDQNTNPQAIGVGSVVGTLTTDGFIGSLTDPTHIVDWNLTVTANTVSENLFGPSSGNNSTIYSLVGPALVASATELTFDFASSTPSEFWIRNGDTYWLLDAFGQLNGSFGREWAAVASPAGPQGAYKNLSSHRL